MIKKITLLSIILISLTVSGQQEKFTIKNLSINNNFSNFGTTFYGEDKVVFASPKKKSYIIKNDWTPNNQPFLDLFVGSISENGELENVEKFSSKLNTRYHESDVAFTKDKKTVYFSRNNYFKNKFVKDSTGINLIQLYRAQINENGEWVNVEAMPFNNDHYQTGHPALSEDEKTLYFVSDMPESLGKTDIFKVSIHENGSFGNPINLGPKINTSEKEMFPFISSNNELYFSSNGRIDGLGNLDIFVVKITDNIISDIQNLGSPINSTFDDFSFIIKENKGYFSSNRDGGKGDDDIYSFTQNLPLNFNCTQLVAGTVVDKETKTLLFGSTVTLFDNLGKEINKQVVDDKANFNFKVDCNKKYKVVGEKQGYVALNKEFVATAENEVEFSIALPLEEVVVNNGNCMIKINPIYFDFDKSVVRADAEIELNKVIKIMKKYPELIIEGRSHTDSRGSETYNESLSTRRANATVEYIISKGIAADRISAKGYGLTKLVNKCAKGIQCSEKEHQLNRRTEFVIMNIEEVRKVYPDLCSIKIVSSQDEFQQVNN